MNNLQGIIARSVDNSTVQFDSLSYITTNVANYNTIGYKNQRFENYLMSAGRIEGTVRTDYSNGLLYATRRPLDVAIDGPGFIPITKKDGSPAYTRDGSFKVNKEGYLVTQDDFIVGDGIKIPYVYHKLKIKPDGEVTVMKDKGDLEETVGKLSLVVFNNPEGLKSIEGNKVVSTDKSGPAILLSEHKNIKQGNLERSNTDLFVSVNDVMRLNASIISSTRLIKIVDDIYTKSINLKQ
jgi:flagellar basal-body rod protein FlgG